MASIENVGYRPKDNLVRWSAIERELERDSTANPVCLEIGSNFGFISSQFANRFPAGRVFSIEGSFGTGNDGTREHLPAEKIKASPGIQAHMRVRSQVGSNNNLICLGLADAAMFERLISAGIRLDYLVSLSVFHWVVDASKGTGGRKLLSDHIRLAKTTFMELPAMDQGTPLKDIYRDYATIPQAISEACKEFGLDVRITYLCSCPWYGIRDTYRIDNLDTRSVDRIFSTDEITSAIGLQTA